MSVGYGKRYMAQSRQSLAYEDRFEPPDYEQAVSASSATDAESIHRRNNSSQWPHSPLLSDPTTPSSVVDPSRQNSVRRPLPQNPNGRPQTNYAPNYERYVYKYRLVAGGAPIHFHISVEPQSGRPTAGKYTFRLSFKTGIVERPICEPVERNLAVGIQPHNLDPRRLEFIVFVFPGKSSLPAGCLWSVRVWLRVDGSEHRLFGDDELWVGKNADFNAIGDASFGRMKLQDSNKQVYHAFVGRALVAFTFRWERVAGTLYRYSLDYDSGGVGANLFDDFRIRVDGDPRNISFLIFTVPANSVPPGASHKLRVWLRIPEPINQDPSSGYVLPFNDSYIYQRIWKTDDFKIGSQLSFENLGPKMIMAFSTAGSETITMPHPPHQNQLRHPSISSIEGLKSKDLGYNF